LARSPCRQGAPGCSHSITPEALEPSPTKISTVALSSIEAADPDRQRIARRFGRSITEAAAAPSVR
jgi:hypothetical protein